MKSGVVQGCPFSPVVFVVFIDYVNGDSDCRFLFFADDSSCICRARTLEGLRDKMKEVFTDFSNFLEKKGLFCEPTKSKILIFHRTVATAKKHFENHLEIPVVDSMRVLGVEFDCRLNFNAHLQNVCNAMRGRVNCLRLLKKNGLTRNHALQFVQSARSRLFFGLWWLTVLSTNQWSQLEHVWNALLRKACHERTSKSIKHDVLHQVAGLGTFRNFVNYLVHLRTLKSMKCDKFTINLGDIQARSVTTVVSVAATRPARPGTRAQTVRNYQVEADKRSTKNWGSIKLFSLKLAESGGWTEAQFKMDKSELRKFYKVARVEPPDWIANKTNDELLTYLKDNSTYRNYTNYY